MFDPFSASHFRSATPARLLRAGGGGGGMRLMDQLPLQSCAGPDAAATRPSERATRLHMLSWVRGFVVACEAWWSQAALWQGYHQLSIPIPAD